MQEWDPIVRKLTGPVRNIYPGTERGLVEGPHLFKRNGWYYLTVAEGGTGYDHAVTMARSRQIEGPYETHPDRHLMTSKDSPKAPLQKAGHGQYVETPDGQAYHTHLCGRPLAPYRRCTLGRETSLQKCVWRDDWLYLEQGGQVPAVEVAPPAPAARQDVAARREYSFDSARLPMDFQWLRTPEPQRIFSVTARPGFLRLYGRESIGSWFEQALVARRQQHHRFRAETRIEFAPETYQQVAGLTHYYNRYKFHALAVTWHETLGRALTILSCPGDYPGGKLVFPIDAGLSLPDGAIDLAFEVTDNDVQFFWRAAGDASQPWQAVGPILDAGVISDEGGRGVDASFTGAFAGLFAFDITGQGQPADFKYFVYEAR